MERSGGAVDTVNRTPISDGAICTLRVGGMDCSSCAETVENALRQLEGVDDVRVDVVGGRVTVEYSGGKLARGDLASAIHRVGYRVKNESSVRRGIFDVEGMHCADEVRLIESRLGNLPGVSRLAFDLMNRRLTVEGEIATAEVERAIASLGMRARIASEERGQASWWERRGRLVLAAVAGVLWALSLAADHLLGADAVAATLAIGAIVSGGWYIVPRGIRAARNRALDMNFVLRLDNLDDDR